MNFFYSFCICKQNNNDYYAEYEEENTYHFCYIKDLSRLISKQVSKQRSKKPNNSFELSNGGTLLTVLYLRKLLSNKLVYIKQWLHASLGMFCQPYMLLISTQSTRIPAQYWIWKIYIFQWPYERCLNLKKMVNVFWLEMTKNSIFSVVPGNVTKEKQQKICQFIIQNKYFPTDNCS